MPTKEDFVSPVPTWRQPGAELGSAVRHIASLSPKFNWVGIYILHGKVLELGPFIGAATEHKRIPVGSGICGKAVAENRDVYNVPDVNRDPAYLACSIETKSELVVLIRDSKGKILGQIDIDSHELGAFTAQDVEKIEIIARGARGFMDRVKKAPPTLDSIFFVTPEQKVMRILLSEPTTAFTPRVISSKLKGVRGLGGTEGILKILNELFELGLVDFVDNRRAVRLHDECTSVQVLKTFAAICDLETLKELLLPVSSKGILFGTRASGRAHTDSEYDLFVVSHRPEEVKQIAAQHPLGKIIAVQAWTPEFYNEIDTRDQRLASKLQGGLILWSSAW